MHRLLLYAFLFLSFPAFSQDPVVNSDTSLVNKDSHTHQIGERYPAPQATLKATLLKGMFSFNIVYSHLILAIAIWLVLLIVLAIVIVRRRKRLKKRG